jgi:VanZ family protein
MNQSLYNWGRRIARWIAVPAIGVVVWGELKPDTHDPQIGWDKLLHFTAYFGLAGIATVALGRGKAALWAAFALAAFGGILEIVQGFVGRDAEWGDELANIVGVCAGLAAGLLTLRILRRSAQQGSGIRGGADENVR